MKPKKTWILIADGARARVVQNDGPGTGVESVFPYDFATSSAPTRERGTERPGRTHARGGGQQTAYQPREDWHTFEKGKFATEMAHMLNERAECRAFDQLILVAPAKTMGVLRAAIRGPVGGRVIGEVLKDLTHLKPHELKPHLGGIIRL